MNKVLKKVLICLFIAVLASCSNNHKENSQDMSIAVETLTAKETSIQSRFDLSSKIISQNNVTVVPKASGTVKSVSVSVGQHVQKGDMIMKIDDTDLNIQLKQAVAAVELAKANAKLSTSGTLENNINQMKAQIDSLQIQLDDSNRNLERTKELYDAGAVSQADLEKVQSGVDTLQTQLEHAKQTLLLNETEVAQATNEVGQSAIIQAQTAVSNIQNMISYTTVRAETSGTITSLSTEEGNVAAAGVPVATISDNDKLKVSLQVSQNIIDRIDVGTPVQIITSKDCTPLNASITNLSRASNMQTSLYPVEIMLENEDGKLYSGMFVTVRIFSDRKDGVIALPINSILEEDGKTYVYKAKGGKAVKSEVVKGIQNDEMAEIVSGVNASDKIIVKGQEFLSQDSAISIVNEDK